jgi:hypothetical protein
MVMKTDAAGPPRAETFSVKNCCSCVALIWYTEKYGEMREGWGGGEGENVEMKLGSFVVAASSGRPSSLSGLPRFWAD